METEEESIPVFPVTHRWPTDGGHLFGRWYVYDKKTFYRACVHPDCNEVQRKDA